MTQSSTYATLIDIAEKATDEAAIKLGNAIRAADDHQKKLDMLKRYREEYSHKMQTEMKAGRDMQHIRNFQVFLGKIDDAIHGQEKLVTDAQKRVQQERLQWQEQEKKRMSFTALEERAEKVQQKKEARRDQIQSDELGSRQAFYKQ